MKFNKNGFLLTILNSIEKKTNFQNFIFNQINEMDFIFTVQKRFLTDFNEVFFL